ncbi:FkbM family methyltransferase [Geodermatophilus sp. CPCC 205506]|uniref:FkbM family methyltransferase n=1 Tax=Geodermatophilus sp. CPCC 205506 TaxID=2936596 RepID=UPI003EE92D75
MTSPIVALKVRVARSLCSDWIGKVVATTFRDNVPHRGARVLTGHSEVQLKTKASLFWGFYESAEVRFVKKYLRPDRDVIELGASIGAVSRHAAKVLHRGRQYVAVEANPRLLGLLAANLRASGADFELVHAAIVGPGQPPRATLSLGETTDGSRIAEPVDAPHGIEVPATTLGRLLDERGMQDVSVISDIEGAEASFLLHDEECRRIGQLIIELHDTQVDGRPVPVRRLVELAGARGLRLVDRRGPVCVFDRAGTAA